MDECISIGQVVRETREPPFSFFLSFSLLFPRRAPSQQYHSLMLLRFPFLLSMCSAWIAENLREQGHIYKLSSRDSGRVFYYFYYCFHYYYYYYHTTTTIILDVFFFFETLLIYVPHPTSVYSYTFDICVAHIYVHCSYRTFFCMLFYFFCCSCSFLSLLFQA